MVTTLFIPRGTNISHRHLKKRISQQFILFHKTLKIGVLGLAFPRDIFILPYTEG